MSLRLPIEVLIQIISNLDGRDLFICTQVSPFFDQCITRTPPLQYKVQLALAGRQDGRSTTASLSARLDAIKAYRAAWAAGTHPVKWETRKTPVSQSGEVFVWMNSQMRQLWVYRPRGHFCGIEERVFSVDSRDRLPWLFARPFLDLPQALLIFLGVSCGIQKRDWERPRCLILGLEDGLPTHPLATGDGTAFGCEVDELGTATEDDSPQILGDLLAWNVGGDPFHPTSDRIIYNWKTNVKLWHAHLPETHRVYLLSAEHFIVVDTRALFVRLYALDPSSLLDIRDPHPLETRCLCVLQLPLPSPYLSRDVRVHTTFQLPAALEADAAAHSLFLHDPSLAVLGFHFDFSGATGDEVEERYVYDLGYEGMSSESREQRPMQERHTLLIPALSILKANNIAHSVPLLVNSPLLVPWVAWGPSGTRMIRAPLSSGRGPCSVLNSQVAFWHWDETKRLGTVTVFEAFPLADQVNGGAEISPEPLRADEQVPEDSPYWQDLGHTTYPVRRTRRTITLPPSSTNTTSRVPQALLSHDGLILLQVRVFVR
ncbi:hypothetical protein C8Q77DRAFT_811256 [Trametes polyzona]|nr:hypothetical protein C8Q77DRAFT_811256 [Trametes polyzona]